MVCLCFTFGWLCACGCLGFFSRFGLWLCVFHCLMMMSRNRWIHLMSQMMSLFFFFSFFPLLLPLSYVSLLFFYWPCWKEVFLCSKKELKLFEEVSTLLFGLGRLYSTLRIVYLFYSLSGTILSLFSASKLLSSYFSIYYLTTSKLLFIKPFTSLLILSIEALNPW